MLGAVRRAKTESKRSLKWPVDRVVVVDSEHRIKALRSVVDDVREASIAAEVVLEVGPEPSVTVELAPEPDEPRGPGSPPRRGADFSGPPVAHLMHGNYTG